MKEHVLDLRGIPKNAPRTPRHRPSRVVPKRIVEQDGVRFASWDCDVIIDNWKILVMRPERPEDGELAAFKRVTPPLPSGMFRSERSGYSRMLERQGRSLESLTKIAANALSIGVSS